MDFLPPPRIPELLDKVRAFLDEEVLPLEPRMHDTEVSLTELMTPVRARASWLIASRSIRHWTAIRWKWS